MPRQLPWKLNGGSKPAPRPRPAESPSAQVPSPGPAGSDRTGSLPGSRPRSGTSTPVGGKPRRSLTARPGRSPSTSPPPEPISEDFMIEGVDHDDRYRMVEDEFLAMANDFTKHLHAAEYQRLKALASSRNADMIRTISRPVTGKMTDLVKKRRSALELAASQRRGIRNALGKRRGRDDSESDDDDGELPWAGTSLQGLMESPRKAAVPLPAGSSSLGHGERASGVRRRSSERPRSGVSAFASRVGTTPSHRHAETTTDDDEDLDMQPRYRSRTVKLEGDDSNSLSLDQKAASIDAMARRRESALLPSRSEAPRSTPAVKVAESLVAMSARQTANDVDDDDEDFLVRIRKRREQQRRRREESGTGDEKKARGKSAVDAIPLF